MAHWYIYREGAPPLGPWPTEVVADAILAGRLDPGTWVAAPAGSKWLRASDVPVIARRLEGQPTRRSAQGAHVPPGADAPDTHRSAPLDAPPPGDPPAPVPSAPPVPRDAGAFYGGGETLESPGNERGRR